MAEFVYKNTKNASTSYTPFELNFSYHPRVSFEENIDHHSKSRFANKLAKELKKLIAVCCRNQLHVYELQNTAYYKKVKKRSYTPNKEV